MRIVPANRRTVEVGEKFGKLTIIGVPFYAGSTSRQHVVCECDCGNSDVYGIYCLRSRNTRSCGCLRRAEGIVVPENQRMVFVGQRSGRLEVLGVPFYVREDGRPSVLQVVVCKCDCGNHCLVRCWSFRKGGNKSCGCLRGPKRKHPEVKARDEFGRLIVIKVFQRYDGRLGAKCQCRCGSIHECRVSALTSGRTQSCGCLHQEGNNYKHGATRKGKIKRLWRIWYQMLHRCTNSKNQRYDLYGGRGIAVCMEWQDYQRFQKWALANGYNVDLTLDRIDPDKGYKHDNCQWIPRTENSRKAVLDRVRKIKDLERENAHLRKRIAELKQQIGQHAGPVNPHLNQEHCPPAKSVQRS
jgi:hypothetical protein